MDSGTLATLCSYLQNQSHGCGSSTWLRIRAILHQTTIRYLIDILDSPLVDKGLTPSQERETEPQESRVLVASSETRRESYFSSDIESEAPEQRALGDEDFGWSTSTSHHQQHHAKRRRVALTQVASKGYLTYVDEGDMDAKTYDCDNQCQVTASSQPPVPPYNNGEQGHMKATATRTKERGTPENGPPERQLQLLIGAPDQCNSWMTVDCRTVQSDRDFFIALRDTYTMWRRRRLSWLPDFLNCRQITDCDFVKFSVLVDTGWTPVDVNILDSYSLPPRSLRHVYSVCEGDVVPLPPIDRATFCHYFYSRWPAHSTGHRAFDSCFTARFPFLTNSLAEEARLVPGIHTVRWGLRMREGISFCRLTIRVLALTCGYSVLSIASGSSLGSVLARVTIICFLATITSVIYIGRKHLLSQIVGVRDKIAVRGRSIRRWMNSHYFTAGRPLLQHQCDCGVTVTFHGPSTRPPIAYGSAITSSPSASSSQTTNTTSSSGSSILTSVRRFLFGSSKNRKRSDEEDRGDRAGQGPVNACDGHVRSPASSKDYYLICACTGPDRLPRLHQIAASTLRDDQELFETLRSFRRPWSVKLIRPWTWFRCVLSLNYISFNVLHDDKVLILHRGGGQAYATTPLNSEEYQPVFTHQDTSHPIPSDWLMPYYNRPRTAGTGDFYLNLLTRRTSGRVESQDFGRALYGMELEEGISKSRITWSAFVLLLICIAVSVGGAKYTQNAQTGLAVGACLMTVVLFLYTVLIALDKRLQPAYNN